MLLLSKTTYKHFLYLNEKLPNSREEAAAQQPPSTHSLKQGHFKDKI